jgi:hypothetical protein
MNKAVKIAGASSIILLLTLVSTDPQRVSSAFLMAPFVLLFIILVSVICFALLPFGMSGRARLRVGLAGGLAPVLLLVLQSLGQLTLRDVLVIMALCGLAYFYTSKLGMKPIG